MENMKNYFKKSIILITNHYNIIHVKSTNKKGKKYHKKNHKIETRMIRYYKIIVVALQPLELCARR